MEKEELKRRVQELIENEDFRKYLNAKIEEIINSGFIDAESEETGSYGLAKDILSCALKSEAEQYSPPNSLLKKYRKLMQYS